MKTTLLIAAALAANVNGAALDPRQRPTSRPGGGGGGGGTPDGIASPIRNRDPQDPPPWLSIGRPTQTVTFFPNDPGDRVVKCGLDAFVGHTSEALLLCSSVLKSGTATVTSTATARETTTTRTTVYTTLYPPTAPSTSARPPTSTPISTPRPPTSSPRPPTSTPVIPPSSVVPPSSSPPTPTGVSCGIVGYTKSTAAYYFDSSGTKNTWTACKAACTADSKCKSFGYGEANCMLFDVPAADNTNYNPMSPYTFYDAACPVELPVKKRQINISLNLPGGPSSACSCLITSGPADTTRTTTSTVIARVTRTETVTRTVSLLPDGP